MQYPWGGECKIPDSSLANGILNQRRPRLLPGELTGRAVWAVGKGYHGDVELLGRRLRLSLPGCFLVAMDGVNLSMPDARTVVPGQDLPTLNVLTLADSGCDLSRAGTHMIKCWAGSDQTISAHHRYSVIPICAALVFAGASKIRLVGCVPGFSTAKRRSGGQYFDNFWIPPEGLSDLREFDKMKAWAATKGTDVSLLAPLNITSGPWQSIGSTIAADMKENNGKWHATAKISEN